MKIPDWWVFLILALASFRVWRLVSEDEVLDTPRRWIVRLPNTWEDGDALPGDYRLGLARFISCSSCFGFWISIAIWLLWLWQPLWTTGLCVPLALSAAVVLVAHFPNED
jgi:hypothetical protein